MKGDCMKTTGNMDMPRHVGAKKSLKGGDTAPPVPKKKKGKGGLAAYIKKMSA